MEEKPESEKTVDSEKVSEPEPEEKPEKKEIESGTVPESVESGKGESTPEMAGEPLVLEDDGLPPVKPKRSRPRSRPRPEPAKPETKEPEKPAPDEEDEFGMVQSEFGF